MSISKTVAEWLSRLAGATAAGRKGTAQPAISARDRAFLEQMLAGVGAQVRHENDLVTARTTARTTVRLVLQVPVIDGGSAWLGGGARLAPGMAWPVLDGAPLQLLAQFDCAQLPADLWGGLGPRQGWLAIFVHPVTLKPKVLHFAIAGDFKPSPPIGPDCNLIGYDGRRDAEACGFTGRFPCWPVTIEVGSASREAPRGPHGGSINHKRYAQRHDFVADGRWPFDWPSMSKMLDIALGEFERLVPAGEGPAWFQPAAIEQSAQAIAAATAAGADAETLGGLDVRHGEKLVSAAVHAHRLEHGARLVATLRALQQRVAEMAQQQAFSSSAVAPILAELQSLTWMHKRTPPFFRDGKKLSEIERAAEGCEAFLLPLTTHDPSAAPTWVNTFEHYLLAAAKSVYLADPAALPARLRADCEEAWRSRAAESFAGIGHVPWRYVHDFDEGADVTLIELPSSDLIGWQFGDVDNLVITLKKNALARGDFSRPLMQISN